MSIGLSQMVLKNHPLFLQISEITFSEEITEIPITSTGNSYIVFAYGNFNINNRFSNNTKPPKYYITPLDNTYKLSCEKNSSFVAIRLNADCFKTISGLDAINHIDQQINLNTIVPEALCKTLWLELQKSTFDDYQSIIDENLQKYYDKWSKPSVVTPIIEYIQKENGMMNVADLQQKFHLSHSTLNRHFKSFIGITPNKFTRLIRFNFIVRHLEKGSDLLADLIIKYQYYDYSHFSKDFKLFTGQTPNEYRGTNHELLKEILFKKVNY